MRVACHQPNLLSALTFWAKLNAADAFMLLDEVQFSRKSARNHYANRCKVGDDKWYTIPIKDRHPQTIGEVEIADGWKVSGMVDRLRNDYGDTPHGKALLKRMLEYMNIGGVLHKQTLLIDINLLLIYWVMEEIGIEKPIKLQSEMGYHESFLNLDEDDFNNPDIRLINLTKEAGGDTYLAGMGGLDYMELELYKDANLKVEFCKYEPIPYPRGERSWVPYMSVFDAMCYVGRDVTKYLECDIIKAEDIGDG